ncbi:MAG UNVERIFIED_CONTAM: molecular chaperone DnaJ [Anaerolineae bacterium]|jgi:molecular chaperone DnaJ
MAKDYYDVLGVSRNASKNEVRQAYRNLARKYHPDVSKEADAEEKFKELNEAYEVIGDDEKRARYDRFGHAGVGATGGRTAGGVGFEDIFEEFFNNFGGVRAGGSNRRGPKPGADRRVDVTIKFEDSIFGVDQEVEYERLETCETCQGFGTAEGSHAATCSTCGGRGEVQSVQQTFLGTMVRSSTCPTCSGSGTIIANPCKTCSGSGRLRKRVKRIVQIPPGVREGLQIQVRGGGDVGESVDAVVGNLYVVVHVMEHEYFKRRENDIILDLAINIPQATLGDKVVVPTVEGNLELNIPAGTQTGKVFRLRGRGAPRLRSDGSSVGRGDQLVYITVEIPTTLTPQQRALFEELAKTMGNEVQPQPNGAGRGFFDRVMTFFGNEGN